MEHQTDQEMVVSQNIVPQYRPQYIMVLIVGTPKMVPLILGTRLTLNPKPPNQQLNRNWAWTGNSSSNERHHVGPVFYTQDLGFRV